MNNPDQRHTSALAGINGRRHWLSRALVAFGSGVVLTPLFLLLFSRLLFPAEASGYGNNSFWVAVLLGGFLAASVVAMLRRMPFWLVAFLGPLMVLYVVILWVARAIATGAA